MKTQNMLTGARGMIHKNKNRSSVDTAGSVAGRGLVAQGGMATVVVVVIFPVADDDAGLRQ
jgi:hypothetical protein